MEMDSNNLKCGIIMPISDCDNCSENHWREVKSIFVDATKNAGFEAELVSEADDIGIIQKRIIQNLYEKPIVICDVSGKNPNVMFELGIRLAFDKPTIIIKDDKTTYSFDTQIIEHITYPRDLRYSKIVEFKETLTSKIKGTFEKSTRDPSYTTFLKNFGEFKSPKLETKEVTKEDFILDELKDMKLQIKYLTNRIGHNSSLEKFRRNHDLELYKNIDYHNNIIDLTRNILIESLVNNKDCTIDHIKNIIVNELDLKYKITVSNEFLDKIINDNIDLINRNIG